jgi:transposase-like protein
MGFKLQDFWSRSMSGKRFSADQWRGWFAEFEQSGLTVRQFCERKGTTANTFYNWQRRLRDDPGSLVVPRKSDEALFVPVKLAASPVEFELSGGVIARVANDRQSLRPLVELLQELGARP